MKNAIHWFRTRSPKGLVLPAALNLTADFGKAARPRIVAGLQNSPDVGKLVVASGPTVATSAEVLVGGVVNALRQEVDAAVRKHKLRTRGMPGAESPG